MRTVDDYDVAFAPLRQDDITEQAIREFSAELPCACAVCEGKMCESCFARIQILEGT